MKKNISLQQFIDDLKKIDVGEMLEKAKTVKIEDLKSIKLKDIKNLSKSKAFSPTIGILIAAVLTSTVLIPSFKSFREKQKLSDLYLNEKNELPTIQDKLNNRKEIKEELNILLPQFKNLIAKSKDLFLLSELLHDSAKRSVVLISELSPMQNDELNSCSSRTDQEFLNNDFSNFNNQNYEPPLDNSGFDNGDEFDINNDFINDGLPDNNSIQLYEFNPSINSGIDVFTNIPKSIDEIFKNNYFAIRINGNYLNILNYLRTIQEYNMMIIPVCFEPSLSQPNYSGNEKIQAIQTGNVEARLIINVPTLIE